MKIRFLLFFSAFLGCTCVWAIPSMSNIGFPSIVGKYQKFEVNFDLNDYINPYDFDEIDTWAEFTSPSGTVSKVYGFYYEGYDKLDDGDYTSFEILTPSSTASWKIRFSPNEVGDWTFKMKAFDKTGSTSAPNSGSFLFSVSQTNEKGFISKANNRYLKFDSGEPFVPIGDSYPFWICEPYRAIANGKERGTNIMKHYLNGMHDNGINYNRFEINLYEGLSLTGRDFVLQKTFHHYYNQRDAWQLDEIMEYAKGQGVNFNLALFPAGNLVDFGSFLYLNPVTQTFVMIPDTNSQGVPVLGFAYGCWSLFNPFNVYQDPRYRPVAPDSAGHCKSRYEYFSNPQAILTQKKFYRYVVSRWGYCTNLIGFELLDEMSQDGEINDNDLNPHYAPTPRNMTQVFQDWTRTMYDFIKSVDPNKHLISTALGNPGDSILGNAINPHMDFVNVHWYTDYGPQATTDWRQPFEYSLADAITNWTQRYDKPVALMEMGWTAAGIAQDPHFYELHNLIWSALFNGSMGLSAVWAHEVEVLGHDALWQYKGVSAFSKHLPLLSENDVPNRFISNGLKWEYLADNVQDEIYGRVQDENFTYLALWSGPYSQYLYTLDSQDRPPIKSNNYSGHFHVDRQGTYLVQWYNTETGELYRSEHVESTDGELILTMPDLLRFSTWADAGFTATFISGAPSLLVYPNPGPGIFQVEMKHDAYTQCQYAIYNNMGMLLQQNEVQLASEQQSFVIDLTAFSPAAYHLVVTVGEERFYKRLIKL